VEFSVVDSFGHALSRKTYSYDTVPIVLRLETISRDKSSARPGHLTASRLSSSLSLVAATRPRRPLFCSPSTRALCVVFGRRLAMPNAACQLPAPMRTPGLVSTHDAFSRGCYVATRRLKRYQDRSRRVARRASHGWTPQTASNGLGHVGEGVPQGSARQRYALVLVYVLARAPLYSSKRIPTPLPTFLFVLRATRALVLERSLFRASRYIYL
jgi:hypothetical protein